MKRLFLFLKSIYNDIRIGLRVSLCVIVPTSLIVSVSLHKYRIPENVSNIFKWILFISVPLIAADLSYWVGKNMRSYLIKKWREVDFNELADFNELDKELDRVESLVLKELDRVESEIKREYKDPEEPEIGNKEEEIKEDDTPIQKIEVNLEYDNYTPVITIKKETKEEIKQKKVKTRYDLLKESKG